MSLCDRECLGSQQTVLAQLCVSDQAVSGDVDLVSLLYWPLQQLHQYSRVLLKLAACYDVVRRKLSALSHLHFHPFFDSNTLKMFLLFPLCFTFSSQNVLYFPRFNTLRYVYTYYCHCTDWNSRCSPSCNTCPLTKTSQI